LVEPTPISYIFTLIESESDSHENLSFPRGETEYLTKCLVSNMCANTEFLIKWVDLIKTKSIEKAFYSQISREELESAVSDVLLGIYQLSPFFHVFFQPGRIGPEKTYRGAPVFPIDSANEHVAIALGTALEYQAVLMNPTDFLVLSALGHLLLHMHYPDYMEDKNYVASLNMELFSAESREDVAKGIAALVCTDAFLNRHVGLLTYQFLLAPYHYYLDGTETKITCIEGEIIHEFFETVSAHYYSGFFYKVPYFYDYIALTSDRIDG